MTGRARGRARGRSRGQAATAALPKPGEKASASSGGGASEPPQVGRGGRGRAAVQAVAAPPPVVQPPPTQAPVQAMAKMTVQDPPGSAMTPKPTPPPAAADDGGRKRERTYGAEPHTRPEHIKDKKGTSGSAITVMSNFVRLKNRPNTVIYQYHVNFSPPVENKRVRYYLIAHKEDLFGKVKTFDGMILFLPHRLPDQVTKYVAALKDGTNVEVSVALTNELSANSPICIQLFNIIFRRSVCVCVGVEVFHCHNLVLIGTVKILVL